MSELISEHSMGCAFRAMSAAVTGAWLVQHGIIPQRLEALIDLVEVVRNVIIISASMRMFNDDLSVHDAFAAVVNSNALRSDFFG